MAAQLQELIEKINQEGVESAQKKGQEIITEAEIKAKDIIASARKEAEDIVKKADTDAKNLEESGHKAIDHSFRNVMLALKEEIAKQFDRILKNETAGIFKPEVMTDIIIKVAKDLADTVGQGKDVEVNLSPGDAEKLRVCLVAKFKKEIKSGLVIKPVKNIDAGFKISLDKGQSHYDFTDQGLKDCLAAYLSPQLKEIIGK